jgi:hypothetical protein
VTRRYLAVLQFRKDGPTVEGQWESKPTARKTYRDWIGLYGELPAVVIRLLEETDGVQRTLRAWTAQGEVVTDPEEPDD